ncbi:hypothetical protein NSU08_35360 [Paenibacillus sp. FSL H7-0331]|uniref:hypothetical protein n=1 Tax=Paenibacillus sp. FSL H7-0331 TaxID=1920421 RepID=UPI0030F6D4EA
MSTSLLTIGNGLRPGMGSRFARKLTLSLPPEWTTIGIYKCPQIIYAAELLDQLANVIKKDDWDVIIIPELGSVGMVAAADKGERNNEKVHTLRS